MTWKEAPRRRPERDGPDPPALRRGDRRRAGRDRARRPAAPARRAARGRRPARRGPATSGAAATSRSACTTRSGTTTCPTCTFPKNWPVFAPKDKIARLAGDVHQGHGGQLLVRPRPARAPPTTRTPSEWTVVVDRDGEELTLRPKQLVLATGMSGKPNVPTLPGQDRFRGEQHHSSQHPGPDAYRARRSWSSGRTTPRSTSAARSGRHGADVTMVQRIVHAHRQVRRR